MQEAVNSITHCLQKHFGAAELHKIKLGLDMSVLSAAPWGYGRMLLASLAPRGSSFCPGAGEAMALEGLYEGQAASNHSNHDKMSVAVS